MAKNTGGNYRKGAVKKRSQVFNPKTKSWVKRNANTGKFMSVKSVKGFFKGIRKEI